MPWAAEGLIFEGALFINGIRGAGYRKIPKITPGAYIFQRPLSTEGNLRFKIDWAIRIVGSKFTVFALFYFVFEGIFPSTSPLGGLYLEERFKGVFLRYRFGGACIWRGLYMEELILGNLGYSTADQNTSCIYLYL